MVRHWWDGSWSTAWRRDVLIYAHHRGGYEVEISQGRDRTARAWFRQLADAEAEARRHLIPGVKWRDLSGPAHQAP